MVESIESVALVEASGDAQVPSFKEVVPDLGCREHARFDQELLVGVVMDAGAVLGEVVFQEADHAPHVDVLEVIGELHLVLDHEKLLVVGHVRFFEHHRDEVDPFNHGQLAVSDGPNYDMGKKRCF